MQSISNPDGVDEHGPGPLRARIAAIEINAQSRIIRCHGLGNLLTERVEEARQAEFLAALDRLGLVDELHNDFLALCAFVEPYKFFFCFTWHYFFPNSLDFSVAASTASMSAPRKPCCSSTRTPAIVVPAGLVT